MSLSLLVGMTVHVYVNFMYSVMEKRAKCVAYCVTARGAIMPCIKINKPLKLAFLHLSNYVI